MAAHLNIEGRNVAISFNIGGKDHLKQKAREFLCQKQAFVMKSEIGGESMECYPEKGGYCLPTTRGNHLLRFD